MGRRLSAIWASIDRLEELGHHLGDQLNRTQVAPFFAPIRYARPEMSMLVGSLDHERGRF